MKPHAFAAVAGLMLLSALAQAQTSEKSSRAYRWVDDKGVVHYGDSVPAESARRQTAELNSQGVVIRQSDAQLSPSEARSAHDREVAAARQRQHDRFLMSTFTSVREIEQLRDERVGLIEAQIVAAQGFLTAAENRMKSLQQRAQNFRPYSQNPTARRMPDPLAEEIVRTRNEEQAQRDVMVRKQEEKQQLRTSFQADIDRYQSLLADRTAGR